MRSERWVAMVRNAAMAEGTGTKVVGGDGAGEDRSSKTLCTLASKGLEGCQHRECKLIGGLARYRTAPAPSSGLPRGCSSRMALR